MKSTVIKRSVVINGHKTSISVEDQFWAALKEIAAKQQLTIAQLVAMVDHDRSEVTNLSSALRLYVLSQYYHPVDNAPTRASDVASRASTGDATAARVE